MEFSDKQIQILETSEKLFAQHGFDGTSVRDIAEHANINVAMISYYFGSKIQLMESLFELRTIHVAMRVEKLLQDQSLEPFQKIEMLIDEYIDRMLEKQQFFKIMICEQVVNKNVAIISMINEMRLKNAASISKLIKHGQKAGAFNKNVDVVLMINTMVGTVSQILISQDFYKEYHKLNTLTKTEYHQHLKKKLRIHIKKIFKIFLTNEL